MLSANQKEWKEWNTGMAIALALKHSTSTSTPGIVYSFSDSYIFWNFLKYTPLAGIYS
jgi:hypothetical protein